MASPISRRTTGHLDDLQQTGARRAASGELAEIVDEVVATIPALTDEQKVELGRILGGRRSGRLPAA